MLTFLNYFLAGWYAGYTDKFYLGSFQIYIAIVCVFSGLGNIALAVLRYRVSEKSLISSRKSTDPSSATSQSTVFLLRASIN
jgi:hypothetical protein